MMDPSIKNLLPGDPKLIENIVSQLKSQGIFDEFRRDCLADVDTKPAYQNLQRRVENFASDFLKSTQWRPDINKNQLRDGLRRHINESGMLTTGVDRIIDQIVNPKIIQIFFPKITEIVRKIFGIDTSSSSSRGSPSIGSGSDSDQVLAFPKPIAVETENGNESSETKMVSMKPGPHAPVQDFPHSVIDKSESSPYIDAIEEQLLVLTGGHEYMKLEQLHSSPISEPACRSNATTKDCTPHVERDREVKRDKSKDDFNKKFDSIAKPLKKTDPKTISKSKSSNSDKPRLSSSEKKKRELSPSKTTTGSKANDSKGAKLDDKKASKPPSEKLKSKSELPRHDDSSQKHYQSKKLPDSKGVDSSSKMQKPLVKSKSFDEKDGGKTKHDKSAKPDKAKDELERPKTTVLAEKSKDGKSRISESDKSSKHRIDKVKSPDKRPDGSSNKHRSSYVDKNRQHHDEKSKSYEKKLISGSHTKSKDSEKSKPKITKAPAFGDKLCEGDKCTSGSKPKIQTKSSPSDMDDKVKRKAELSKTKSEQKGRSSTSGAIPSTRPEKVSGKKPLQEGLAIGDKSETSIKDGGINNKVLKRQFSGSPDTSVISKKAKQDDGHPGQKNTKNTQPSSPNHQSSTSDSYSSSDDEEFKEFNAADVLSPAKIREDIFKKAGAHGGDALSDVTVSSVHTSDLSDFDDRITLSESEEEKAQNISPRKKSRSLPNCQEEPKPVEETLRAPAEVKDKVTEETVEHKELINQQVNDRLAKIEIHEKQEREAEPRRELRRQRKLNPRYASDDFSSFFNSGKDRQNHGHIFEHVEDLHHEMSEIPSRRRRNTGQSTTTDETEFPSSPISDASELGEIVKAKRSGKGKQCTPPESSDGDHSYKGPRSISSEANESEDFRPRTSSQQSGGGRKGKQESSAPVEHITSPNSDSNGRQNSKVEIASESVALPKRAAARHDNQRYSSTDLYKPRPVFTSSRRRATSPSKEAPSCSDFGPLVIDEGQQSPQGKRRLPEKKYSSKSKRHR